VNDVRKIKFEHSLPIFTSSKGQGAPQRSKPISFLQGLKKRSCHKFLRRHDPPIMPVDQQAAQKLFGHREPAVSAALGAAEAKFIEVGQELQSIVTQRYDISGFSSLVVTHGFEAVKFLRRVNAAIRASVTEEMGVFERHHGDQCVAVFHKGQIVPTDTVLDKPWPRSAAALIATGAAYRKLAKDFATEFKCVVSPLRIGSSGCSRGKMFTTVGCLTAHLPLGFLSVAIETELGNQQDENSIAVRNAHVSAMNLCDFGTREALQATLQFYSDCHSRDNSKQFKKLEELREVAIKGCDGACIALIDAEAIEDTDKETVLEIFGKAQWLFSRLPGVPLELQGINQKYKRIKEIWLFSLPGSSNAEGKTS
jgi:hypothetical protein